MQREVTVALATIWLLVSLGGRGATAATLHPSYLPPDQYSPAPPPRLRQLYQTQADQLHWNDGDRDRPYDLSIIAPRTSNHPDESSLDPFQLGYPAKDLTLLPKDRLDNDVRKENQESFSSPPDTEDSFVADDTFQDQGPGSVEIYKLDLVKEKALLAPSTTTTTTTTTTSKPAPKMRNKSKVPKKTSHVNWKSKTSELKTTSPKVVHRQSNFFDELPTEIPPNSEANFGSGGVPELQVGCEGLEASHKQKRSIEEKIKTGIDVTPISIDFEYELSAEDNYEEMDELLKLKRFESTTKKPKQNRGDMDATLDGNDFYGNRKPDKLPVRGDLGKSTGEGKLESAALIADKHPSGSYDALAKNTRKLLWVDEEDGIRKREKRSVWGYGEEEGVVSSDELQTENQRRRQHYERTRLEELRRREEARNQSQAQIHDIREEYEHMLEQRKREEEDRRRRLEESNTQREIPNRHEEEERRRELEEHRRRTAYQHHNRHYQTTERYPQDSNSHQEQNRRSDEEERRRELEERRRTAYQHHNRNYQTTERSRSEERYPEENNSHHQQQHRRFEEERRRLLEEHRRRTVYNNPERRYQTTPRTEEDEQAEPENNYRPRHRLHEEQERKREQQRLESEKRRQEYEEARKRYEAQEQRRAPHEDQPRSPDSDSRQHQSPSRNLSPEERSHLEERRRQWMLKRQQHEEEEERRRQENARRQPPSNLLYPHQSPVNQTGRSRDAEEIQREQKLREYIQRNQPININRTGGSGRDANPPSDPRNLTSLRDHEEEYRRRTEEHRRRLEEERRSEDHRRRLEEERRGQEQPRRSQSQESPRSYEYLRHGQEEVDRRSHGPSAPAETVAARGSYAGDARRRQDARRIEEERTRGAEEELGREMLRREEALRRVQSRRYEEDRKRQDVMRVEAERRRKELVEEQARRSQAGRHRQESRRPDFQDHRIQEQRRRPETSLHPGNLVLDEARRAAGRQRQDQERRRLDAERRQQEEDRMKEARQKEEHERAMREQTRRREEARLNALPVSARIIVRPVGSAPATPATRMTFGARFGNDIDFSGLNPYGQGVPASKFPAPPTQRPPAQSPGPCVWAVVQCCPTNKNRLVTCFESMGCPGVNWDPNPCRGSIAKAARDEVAKFYAAAERDEYVKA